MVRLDERMRIGSRTTDRLGMLCATGAVACLASLIIRSPRELPVERSHWEQIRFGDLAAPVASRASPGAAASPDVDRELSVTELSVPNDARRDETNLVEFTPDPTDNSTDVPTDNPMDTAAAMPPGGGPSAERAQFIHRVRYQSPVRAPTVWLSGDIELLSEDAAPTSQRGARSFTDVQRQPDRY